MQVITGSYDKTIRMYDIRKPSTISTLTYHKKSVRALAQHPREYAFASGGADNIKKFSLPDGEFLHNMLQVHAFGVIVLKASHPPCIVCAHLWGVWHLGGVSRHNILLWSLCINCKLAGFQGCSSLGCSSWSSARPVEQSGAVRLQDRTLMPAQLR